MNVRFARYFEEVEEANIRLFFSLLITPTQHFAVFDKSVRPYQSQKMGSIEVSNGTTNGTTNGSTNGIKANGASHHASIIPSVDVAVSPNDGDNVSSITESIESLGKSFSPSDDASRIQLLSEARQLVRALETPRETMIKHNWAQVSD